MQEPVIVLLFWQAKPETVNKVCEIVKKQLALPDDSTVTGESKFAALGADSLDTVTVFTSFTIYALKLILLLLFSTITITVFLIPPFPFSLLWLTFGESQSRIDLNFLFFISKMMG